MKPSKGINQEHLGEVVQVRGQKYGIANNILHNMTVRDVVPICASFDEHYAKKLEETDRLFSSAATICFVASREDTGMKEEYQKVLVGLMFNTLHSFGSAVILLRNGMPDACLLVVRQVIEMCSTVIELVSDPMDEAFSTFIGGKYRSSHSIAQAKKAIPLIGLFWGFLSNTVVHISDHYSKPRVPGPYKPDDEDVKAVLTCLRMTAWVCYLTTELSFPTVRNENRYWKLRSIGDRNAVAYDPNEEEREWSAKFLDLEGVGADDIAGEVIGLEVPGAP